MSLLLVASTVTVMAVFAVSAAGKLRSPAAFAASLLPLALVPDRLVPTVAVAVTAAEAVTAGGLAVALALALAGAPGTPVLLAALASAGALLTALTIGVVLALHRGSAASCACFGATRRPLGRRHVARNAVLTGAVAVAVATAGVPAPPPPGTVLAGVAGMAAAALLIRLDEIVELFTPSAALGAADPP